MSNFDPADLIYLAILLVGVGSLVFGDFRNRFSQSIQHAAIWVLIFFGAVALYGVSDTIEAQLFPRSTVQVDGEEILLTRARDGHFYATLKINDADITFVVDTGATGVVINQADARAIGFEPDKLNYSGRAQTANGTVRTASVRLERVEFGGQIDNNIRASVNAGELDTSLLGMTYLERFEKIEITRDQLRLVP